MAATAAEQTSGVAASGWLQTLNPRLLNVRCNPMQTVASITGRFRKRQELMRPAWSSAAHIHHLAKSASCACEEFICESAGLVLGMSFGCRVISATHPSIEAAALLELPETSLPLVAITRYIGKTKPLMLRNRAFSNRSAMPRPKRAYSRNHSVNSSPPVPGRLPQAETRTVR